MDKDVVNFITNQNETLRKTLKDDMTEIIGLQSTVISARVDNKIDQKMNNMMGKVDSICAHNERQNGWIKDHTERIMKNENSLEKELWFFRLIGRNPKISAIVFLILIMAGAYGITKININKTIEKAIPVVIQE